MTFVIILVGLLAGGGAIGWLGGLFAARRIERRVVVDRLTRRYVIWLPQSHKKKTAYPVLLAFHAGFGSADGFERQTALHLAKEARKFIIVYPEGYKRSWNAGDCCGPAMRENVNDRKFVSSLLDDLESVVAIDRRRIYATGFSNGAQLCYFLASTMPAVFAAIAPAGGAVLTQYSPAQPIAILHIHGVEDKYAPYRGGKSVRKTVPPCLPVEQGLEFWRSLAKTSEESRGSLFGVDDCSTFSGGIDGIKIALCRIPGLGHHWPGGKLDDKYREFNAQYNLGPIGPPIEIADPLLRFLLGFALPNAPAKRSQAPMRQPEPAT